MIVVDVIGEIIGRIFVDIIFEVVILGTLKKVKQGYRFFKKKLTGHIKEVPTNSVQRREKDLLYKNIELTENLNQLLRVGQKGVVLEIIDENQIFAEFYNSRGTQIEVDNDLVFKVEMNQFKLED